MNNICKRISVTSGKGGVGATNTVISIGHWLAIKGQRTLIFDQDRQADVSKLLGLSSGNQAANFLNRLIEADKASLATGRDHLSLIPANHKIAGVERTFSQMMIEQDTPEEKVAIREMIATRMGEAGDLFDITIIDPPKTGEIQQAAITASDLLIVPTLLDYASISNCVAMVTLATQLLPEGARIVVLPIALDGRRKAVEQVMIDDLAVNCHKAAGDRSLTVAKGIPDSVVIKDAGFAGKTIWEYAPKSAVALAYDEYCATTFGS